MRPGGIAAPCRPNRRRIAPCVSASNLFRHPACPPGGSPARHSLVELNEAAEIQESQGRAAPAFRDSALALSLDMIGDGNRKVRPALAPLLAGLLRDIARPDPSVPGRPPVKIVSGPAASKQS